MFYEGRIETVWTIDKDEIMSIINGNGNELKHIKRNDGSMQNAELYSSVLYVFEHNNRKYGFANDSSSCNGIEELAIIDFDKKAQIESLTIEWVKGDKLEAILNCCDNPAILKPINIEFDENLKVIKQPETYFTCSCCGSGFKSTQKEQSKFDLDTGYGLCDETINNCKKDW